MSFKSAIEKLNGLLQKKSQKQKNNDEYVLSELISGAEFVYSTATKSALRTLYIYLADGANFDLVKEIYAEHGIQLKKHTSHLDNKKRDVLYIGTEDIMNLTEEQQAFLNRTAPVDKNYKRTVHLSVKKSHVR